MKHKRSFFFVCSIGVLLLGILAWLPVKQAYWDSEVRRLCATDGGDRVYETVPVPADQFDPYRGGELKGVDHSSGQISVGSGYTYSSETRFYKKGNPDMRSTHFRIIRSNDGKLMGETTSFGRRGGDFLEGLGAPPSHFRCPNGAEGDIPFLLRKVFIPKKDSQ